MEDLLRLTTLTRKQYDRFLAAQPPLSNATLDKWQTEVLQYWEQSTWERCANEYIAGCITQVESDIMGCYIHPETMYTIQTYILCLQLFVQFYDHVHEHFNKAMEAFLRPYHQPGKALSTTQEKALEKLFKQLGNEADDLQLDMKEVVLWGDYVILPMFTESVKKSLIYAGKGNPKPRIEYMRNNIAPLVNHIKRISRPWGEKLQLHLKLFNEVEEQQLHKSDFKRNLAPEALRFQKEYYDKRLDAGLVDEVVEEKRQESFAKSRLVHRPEGLPLSLGARNAFTAFNQILERYLVEPALPAHACTELQRMDLRRLITAYRKGDNELGRMPTNVRPERNQNSNLPTILEDDNRPKTAGEICRILESMTLEKWAMLKDFDANEAHFIFYPMIYCKDFVVLFTLAEMDERGVLGGGQRININTRRLCAMVSKLEFETSETQIAPIETPDAPLTDSQPLGSTQNDSEIEVDPNNLSGTTRIGTESIYDFEFDFGEDSEDSSQQSGSSGTSEDDAANPGDSTATRLRNYFSRALNLFLAYRSGR
ncbi:hypothetical protein ABW20_dc0104798 [Dactylellina cionopaga]|nr:hypothetical protein ABW20_dc0104798 [Dactylellina cionopaga]